MRCQRPPKTPPPILKTNSKIVDVQDGDKFIKGGWSIDPAIPLDIYDAQRTTTAKKVTFTSDIESISFDVAPGRTYDCNIVLIGRDICRTRVSTRTG